ncbi:hypothetical protein [Haloglomus litoreum]|uniref:hypothetical protein n=1 Tax=Haloglomus litoreum TaxID=3034026 RepID=UPI0023E7A472|nr:hypothetical protein [Haloglomus sp. DT116]
MRLDARTTLTVAAVLVAALALVAAPAAADDGDDIGIATGDGINSTIDLSAAGEEAGNGGGASLDCEGQPTHHDCEKGGELHSEAGSVDYTGDNYGDDDDLRAGGGDEVTVAGQGQEATVGFDCDLSTSPAADDCAVDAPSQGVGGAGAGDAPAPSSSSGEVPGSADIDAGVFDGEGINSTVGAGYEGGSGPGASDGAVDCVGQPSHHQCDKGGSLTLGPLGVDYVGDNYADDDDTRFGGGDEFIVSGGGEELLVGFDCDFTTSPSQKTCDFDLGSSQGDAPGQFGPEDGEFDNEGEGPGDERSEEGAENGNDDENRNRNAR